MLQLHSAVLLFALAGLFAKWLPLSAYWLVLGRTGFAALTLFVLLALFKRERLDIQWRHSLLFFTAGLLLLVHWLTFFYAIQLSTVAFGLLVFATFPMFTLFINAFAARSMPSIADFIQAIIMVLGVSLLVSEQGLVANRSALILGLGSAFTFSALLAINQKLAVYYRSATIAGYQNIVAFMLALPFGALMQEPITTVVNYLPELVVLGVVFTAIAHTLVTSALRVLSAFVVGLAICLEPVYGSVAAVLLLDEPLTFGVISGGLVILAVNFYHVLTSNR